MISSKIIQESGLLWETFPKSRRKRMLSVFEADDLAYKNGYNYAENLVKAMKNNEINSCDGGHLTKDELRILPISKNSGNLIVCYGCFLQEMKGRVNGAKVNGKEYYEFPKWDELKKYEAE